MKNMKIIYLAIIAALPMLVVAQKKAAAGSVTNNIYYKLLVGKWKDIDEDNSRLEVNRSEFIFTTLDNTIDTLRYSYLLSTSCEVKDSLDGSKFNQLDHTHNIYLLLFYKDDHKYDDCGNVQNLNIDAISWVR